MSLLGIQTPRISFSPPSVVSTEAAVETADLCEAAGLILDPWQVNTLHLMLGETAAHEWAAFEFGYQTQRQNGKGGVLEARELGGLFLFGEQDIIHSAHAADTARKAFLRMRNIIDGAAFLSKRVKKIIAAPGREHIELMDGRMLEYRTRTSGGGRGFSGTPVILDEAQELSSDELAAIMPVVSAQPNPQIIYTGTVKADAYVFRSVVERGRKQLGDALGYAEWSAPDDADSDDVEAWRQANPAMGIRITERYIRNELAGFREHAEEKWRMERLGIWPAADMVGSVIPVDAWTRCQDPNAGWTPHAEQSVGVAVSPDREHAAVAVAEKRADGKTYVEVVAISGYELTPGARFPRGVDWVLPWLAERAGVRKPSTVVVDKGGPTFSLAADMTLVGLPLRVTETSDYKTACAQFVDAVKAGRVVHRGQTPLDTAAFGVKEHRVGDAWVYARRDSGVLVAPLEAVTLAAWGLNPDPKKKKFFVMNLNDYVGGENQ